MAFLHMRPALVAMESSVISAVKNPSKCETLPLHVGCVGFAAPTALSSIVYVESDAVGVTNNPWGIILWVMRIV